MHARELFIYLRVRNGQDAVDFYTRAFGARERFRLVEPGGRVGHLELDLAGTIVMVCEEFPELGVLAPGPQGAAVSLHLHVDNADEVIAGAVKAGAEMVRPPADQFYGERSGTVRDPFGYEWLIGHEIEALDPAEMQRRYEALFSGE